MSFVVVVADQLDEQGLDLLRNDPDFEVISTVGEPDRLPNALAGAHALLVRSSTRVTEQLIADAPNLRVIGRAGIGVDNINLDAATRHGIAVLNAPGANTVSAAEHAFALLLALVRRVPWAMHSMRDGQWDRSRFGGTELRGKTLGLLGLGRIGAHVAGIARAFGMQVIAFDPFLPATRAKELRVGLVTLEALLERSDVISLHAPMTDDTRRCLNRERLAMMKPTAVVINTARGGLIDDEALVEAIEADRLAGAALDVFDPEPLPDDSPLRTSDRIILTPHLAASTEEAQVRVSCEISRSIRDALRTGDIGGAVNVPGVSSELLARLRSEMDLARRIGRLAAQIAQGPIHSVDVQYGGRDEEAPRPIQLAAIEGVVRAMGIGQVSLVNAMVIAEGRDIKLSRRVSKPDAGFETTIGVAVETPDGPTTVVGAVVGARQGRVIRIDQHQVDIPPEGYVLILKNRDIPGVIGRVGTVLGAGNVNIGFYHQSRGGQPGDHALAAIAVDQPPSADLIRNLEALEDVVQVRLADLDGSPA